MARTFFDKVQAGNILHKLWQRRENETSCDVVLIAGTERKRIPAHRSILSAASEYFDRLLDVNTTKEVEVPGLNGVILQRVIEYCYTGRIEINEDIAVELLKTAHMLFLNNLVRACENSLADQLHPSNCFGLALLAERYHCEKLSEKANDYCLKELLRMYGTDEFLSLKVEQVSQLLDSDDLCVESSEENVFNRLMEWIEHDQNDREKHKVELLKLVRMPLMERSFLIKNVKPFCTSIECLHIYIEGLECHLPPENNVRVFSESKLTKPRGPDQQMLGITLSKPDNKMFIHYYCPQENKWMKWVKNLEYRLLFGYAVIENDLFIAGGKDAKNNILNTVICLNLKTMTLKKISPMQERRAYLCPVVLNGFLYVVGGSNGSNSESLLSSVEKFDPNSNKWEAVASMSVTRGNMGIAALNQKLYVVGGYSNGKELSSAECYDPIQNVWQSIASMSESRQIPRVAVANGLLYAVGGFKSKKTVERYDPQTNKWSAVCSLRQEKTDFSLGCTTLRDKVVVCYNDHIEVYNSATNEWKNIASFKSLDIQIIFSYSDKLLTKEFIES